MDTQKLDDLEKVTLVLRKVKDMIMQQPNVSEEYKKATEKEVDELDNYLAEMRVLLEDDRFEEAAELYEKASKFLQSAKARCEADIKERCIPEQLPFLKSLPFDDSAKLLERIKSDAGSAHDCGLMLYDIHKKMDELIIDQVCTKDAPPHMKGAVRLILFSSAFQSPVLELLSRLGCTPEQLKPMLEQTWNVIQKAESQATPKPPTP